jgi:hypothetical protein
MEPIATYLMVMLVTMAVGLLIVAAAVFSIGICEAASWIWMRFHLHAAALGRSAAEHR